MTRAAQTRPFKQRDELKNLESERLSDINLPKPPLRDGTNPNKMPDEETLTPDGTETEIEQELEIPAEEINYEEKYKEAEAKRIAAEQEAETYKTKFGESTREQQIAAAKLKEAESLRNIETTDAELKKAYPNWDVMTENEQYLAKREFETSKRTEYVFNDMRKREEEEKWTRELKSVIVSNSDLEGHERAFEEFASKPTHRGAPMDILVDAFLRKNPAEPVTIRQPGGLETGSGGDKSVPVKKSLSGADLAALRLSDEKAYRQYIMTHDLDID